MSIEKEIAIFRKNINEFGQVFSSVEPADIIESVKNIIEEVENPSQKLRKISSELIQECILHEEDENLMGRPINKLYESARSFLKALNERFDENKPPLTTPNTPINQTFNFSQAQNNNQETHIENKSLNQINIDLKNEFNHLYSVIENKNLYNKQEIIQEVKAIESETSKVCVNRNVIKKSLDFLKDHAPWIIALLNPIIGKALRF